MATGDKVRLGTLKLRGEKVRVPSTPYGTNHDIPLYKGGLIEIGDTDPSSLYSLTFVEANVKFGSSEETKIFIADRNILVNISPQELDRQGLLYGKRVFIDGEEYLLRALTGGPFAYSGGIAPGNNGGSDRNEWDSFIARKTGSYSGLPIPGTNDRDESRDHSSSSFNAFWNFYGVSSWVCDGAPIYDKSTRSRTNRYAMRGNTSAYKYDYYFIDTKKKDIGWRPVLEKIDKKILKEDDDIRKRVVYEGKTGSLPVLNAEISTRFGITSGNATTGTSTSTTSDDEFTVNWLRFNVEGKDLLIAEGNIRTGVPYSELADKGVIYGNRTIFIGSKRYKIRLLSGYSNIVYDGGSITTLPSDTDSEWDKTIGLLNLSSITNHSVRYSYTQERSKDNYDLCVVRGGRSNPNYITTSSISRNLNDHGWRPVLEEVPKDTVLDLSYGSAYSELDYYGDTIEGTRFKSVKGFLSTKGLLSIAGLDRSKFSSFLRGTYEDLEWDRFLIDGKKLYVAPPIGTIVWKNLNEAGLVRGKPIYLGNRKYRLRLLQGGNLMYQDVWFKDHYYLGTEADILQGLGIRISNSLWTGEIGEEGRFAVFRRAISEPGKKNVSTISIDSTTPYLWVPVLEEITVDSIEMDTPTSLLNPTNIQSLPNGTVIQVKSHSKNGETIRKEVMKVSSEFNGKKANLMQFKKIQKMAMFDAREPSNPNTSIQSGGNGNYLLSNLRQYLNATLKTNWYSKKHSYDSPPDKLGIYDPIVYERPDEGFYVDDPGFLLEYLHGAVRADMVPNGTDYLFLPSISDMKLDSSKKGFQLFGDRMLLFKQLDTQYYCSRPQAIESLSRVHLDREELHDGGVNFWWTSDIASDPSRALIINPKLSGSGSFNSPALASIPLGVAPMFLLRESSRCKINNLLGVLEHIPGSMSSSVIKNGSMIQIKYLLVMDEKAPIFGFKVIKKENSLISSQGEIL